jgi:hypothetical protein
VSYGIGRAAVHLHVHNEFFDLVVSGGFIQTDQPAAQHGHTDTDRLPRAKVAVGSSRVI